MVAYTNNNLPKYPLVIGKKPRPTLRASLGVLRNYVGNGKMKMMKKRRVMRGYGPRKKLHAVKKVLRGVNSFLKKSKLISSVGAPLISTLPVEYQVPANIALNYAREAGYGKKGRGPIKRTIKRGLKHVNKFLKNTKIISKTARAFDYAVPVEYKPYADAVISSVDRAGYGKCNKMCGGRMMNSGPLRGGGKPLYYKRDNVITTRNLLGGNMPYRFNSASYP